MKKAAASVSFLIATVLILFLLISFGVAVNREMKRDSPEARAQDTKDAENGVVTIGSDEGPSSLTSLICGLAGGAFLVAGFALWPKTESSELSADPT